jgi:hypothetical protein
MFPPVMFATPGTRDDRAAKAQNKAFVSDEIEDAPADGTLTAHSPAGTRHVPLSARLMEP